MAAVTATPIVDDTFVQALVLDFEQDAMIRPRAEIAALYQAACDAGSALACRYPEWHRAETPDRAAALSVFGPACESGAPDACLVPGWIGTQVDFGSPSAQGSDLVGGVRAFTLGCDRGEPRACAELGFLARRGVGAPLDPARAVTLLTAACEAEVGNACAGLGDMYAEGDGIPVDAARATELREEGCLLGDAGGCHALGDLRAEEGNAAAAVRYYQLGCERGHGNSCADLGDAYEDGDGTPRDTALAERTLRRGCDLGSNVSCRGLGVLLSWGADGREDLGEAEAVFRKACERGLASACTNLGDLLLDNPSRGGTPREALALFRRACDGGSAMGCLQAARGLTGGPPDEALLRRACDLGAQHACVELGQLLPQGSVEALQLYEAACDAGTWFGCHTLGDAVVRTDPVAGIAAWARACSGGMGESCVRAEDERQAMKPGDLLSDVGAGCGPSDPAACTEAARVVWRTESAAKAVPWLRRGCEAGDGAACRILATFAVTGTAMPRDVDGALKLLDRGCDAGDFYACERLALHYRRGLGVPVDATREWEAGRKVCDLLGSGEACHDRNWRGYGYAWARQKPTLYYPESVKSEDVPFALCRVRIEFNALGGVRRVFPLDCDPGFESRMIGTISQWSVAWTGTGTPPPREMRTTFVNSLVEAQLSH